MSFFLWSVDMAARLLEFRRRFPVAFVLFTWNFLQTFYFNFVCHKKTSFFGQNVSCKKRWVDETASSTRIINGSCKHCISEKKSATINEKKYNNNNNNVFNPPKSFLDLKKSTLGFCWLLKGRSLKKKKGNTPSSHIFHSLRGEYCWMVRASEPIRLLKSPRSLSVCILMKNIPFERRKKWPRQVYREVRLIKVSFRAIQGNYLRDFGSWRLKRAWPLTSGLLK